jgi:hypothetical protein
MASFVVFFALSKPVKFFEDFCRYYLIGKLASGPDRFSFYSLAVQSKTITDFWSASAFPGGRAFNTPPIVIPLVVFLSLFDVRFAYWLWCGLNAGLFLLGTWLIISTRAIKSNRMRLLLLIFAGTLASVPGANNVAEGQAAGIICGLIAIFFYAYQQQRHIICGITLGLVAFKFQYLPFLLVPVFVGQRWLSLLLMTITDLVLLAVTAMAIGWPNLIGYPAFVLKIEEDPHYSALISPQRMVNLKGLIAALSPNLDLKYSIVWLCIVLAWLTLVWLSAKKKPARLSWAVSLTVLSAIFFSPHTHNYDNILLIIPLLFTCPVVSLAESFSVSPLVLKVWNVTLVAMPALTWSLRFLDENPLNLKFLSQLSIDVFLLILAWLNFRRVSL